MKSNKLIDRITYIEECEIKKYITTDYKSNKYYVNSVHISNKKDRAKIIGKSIINIGHYFIQFLDEFKAIKEVDVTNIKRGRFLNPYAKTLYNTGYLGEGSYEVNINGITTMAYDRWRNMIKRCYSEICCINDPSYNEATVDERWHCFQTFAEWYYENGIHEYHLDKDLLGNGVKIYSPETCIFIPQSVNIFLTNIRSNNKSGFIGVFWSNSDSAWLARIGLYGENKEKHLGSFKTAEEASEAYQKARAIEAEKVKEEMRQLGYWNEYIINHIM